MMRKVITMFCLFFPCILEIRIHDLGREEAAPSGRATNLPLAPPLHAAFFPPRETKVQKTGRYSQESRAASPSAGGGGQKNCSERGEK